MAYVSVPKDLSKVKTKVLLNLTKRQLVCFSIAAIVGIPVYFMTKGIIGNSAAVMAMIVFMLPAFVAAMYEKDGITAEKILIHIVRAKWFCPTRRPYKTENIYQTIEQEGKAFAEYEKEQATGKAAAKPRKS